MSRILSLLFALPLLVAASDYVLPAFPGAEGWGMAPTGGRGGPVKYVTRLDDTNPDGTGVEGDLRWALKSSGGPRVVIVKTNGWITLDKPIFLSGAHSSFTLVGHKAPGDGAGVRAGATMQGNALIYTSTGPPTNIIIRFMRFRMGVAGGNSDTMLLGNILGPGITNAIIANCSFGWGGDETASFQWADRFTLQDNIIAETIDNDEAYGPNVASHNLGGLNSGNITILRNLYAHNYSRNPHTRGPVDVINNVTFNTWMSVHNTWDTGTPTPKQVNIIGNYFIPGPWTNAYTSRQPEEQVTYGGQSPSPPVELHLAGNDVRGYTITDQMQLILNDVVGGGNFAKFTGRPWYNERTAADAFEYVTNNVGAYLPVRDSVDARYIAEIHGQAVDGDTFNGWITSEDDVGGYPTLAAGTPYTDTDLDGMEDSWEQFYFSTLARDGRSDNDGDGYTDLEEYLWGTNPNVYVDYYRDFYTGALRSDDEVDPPPPPPGPPPVHGSVMAVDGLIVGDGIIRAD